MKCNNCGRQIQNEAANFCEYCGASFREQAQTTRVEAAGQPFSNIPGMQSGPIPMNISNPMTGAGQPGTQEKPISFINWLGSYALIFIPYVGWLVFIVMLFVWAFSNTTPATKKNWARGTLIFVGILAVILVLFIIVFYLPMLQQMMDGTFDINSYYKSISNNLN